MDPERWARVKELFHGALEREPAEHDRFLRDACAGDESLRETVAAMLARQPEAIAFLEAPATRRLAVLPGTRLGPYEVVDLLGAGGMGEVYRARDTRLGREVAVKVLPEHVAHDPEALRRFDREGRAVAALSHPHIAALFDIGEADGTQYLVMELLEGETLAERLKRGVLPEKDALRIGAEIAEALGAAHGQGVVHRDVKPDNVMLTRSGSKLLDFGLARLPPGPRSPGEPATSTTGVVTGVVAGTLPYMAPEQLEGRLADAGTDVWALGCVLFEMLTGERAFEGDSPPRLVAAIEKDEAPSAASRRPGTSVALDRLVRRCLRKDPAERWSSAHDLALHLREIAEADTGVSWFRIGRNRRLAGALALMAVCALAVTTTEDRLRGWLTRGRGADAIESLAVLPLENRSGDPEQEYLADGMTEALITALGRIGALRVISYTSALQYKGVKKSLPDVARELNVDALVEGSIQRAGDRVRITARLVGAVPERHLWTDSYERGVGDVLALSSEMARTISREIQIMLTIQDHARLASVGPVDPEVQEAYLKGRYFWSKHTEEGDRKSREYFQRAIDKDPHFAPAHAGMADSYVSMSNEGGLLPPGQAYSSAKAAALRALELDDSLAQAHVALAKVAIFHEWDWETADRELRRAIELNPGDPEAHIRSATLLVVQGRTEQAIERARVALAQDPLSLWLADALASLYWVARRFDEAIALCRRTLEMEPQRSGTLIWLGKAYLGKGDYEEAITHLEKAVTLSTDGRAGWSQLAGAYAMAGRRDEARRLLGKESEPTLIAHVHAALGEKDEAFAFLEKAFETRDHRLVWLKTEQAVDSLRSDPRFSDLLRRLNLPE